MPRVRNINRERAFEIYKKHFARITSKEIASILGEKERNIKYWKSKDKWKEKYNPKGGAPKGNKNAVGNKGGGAPKGNKNAKKKHNSVKAFSFKEGEFYEELKNMAKRRANKDI